MCLKICDKSGLNEIGEGIVSQKTGIPKVSNIHSSNDSKMYILNWTSEDGKIIDAQITKNKKVDILSVNNIKMTYIIISHFCLIISCNYNRYLSDY